MTWGHSEPGAAYVIEQSSCSVDTTAEVVVHKLVECVRGKLDVCGCMHQYKATNILEKDLRCLIKHQSNTDLYNPESLSQEFATHEH